MNHQFKAAINSNFDTEIKLLREFYILLCDLNWQCQDPSGQEWRSSVMDAEHALDTIQPPLAAIKHALRGLG